MIIVAQRVGTIMNADRIVVLDDGRVVGIGTHRELLATNETYREIVYSQLSEAGGRGMSGRPGAAAGAGPRAAAPGGARRRGRRRRGPPVRAAVGPAG